jgi:hypothetical protein
MSFTGLQHENTKLIPITIQFSFCQGFVLRDCSGNGAV